MKFLRLNRQNLIQKYILKYNYKIVKDAFEDELCLDSEETLLGNVLSDSMADYYEDATIALINNGGIRDYK